jgi:hypothetical protein
MKLTPILTAAFGGGAKLLGTASSLAIVVGAIYLVDCRMHSSGSDGIDRCYLSALPMMGLGAGTAGGFLAGYQTFNPALRPKDAEESQGLFRKRRQP